MEGMLTWEHVESFRYQTKSTFPAFILLVYRHESTPQILDILLDGFSRLGSIVHFRSEAFNLFSVILQGGTDFSLEIINDHKVGEEG